MAKRSKNKKALSKANPAKFTDTVTVGQGLPAWCKHGWIFGVILLLAVLLTYQPVWDAGYIWDDDSLITSNPCIVGPLGLKEIWTTSAAEICPLTLTTLWVAHALWGLSPLPYHILNVFLHAACAVVLWRVLCRLQIPGAWLGAALWALHPVQVESVAWITEMKNTQSGLFFLLSILFFVKWLGARENDGQTGGGWNYALTLIFAALAMASKSSTVILPVVLCLCAWWIEGRWQWRNLARVAPIFLMSLAASATSIWTQKLQLATAVDPRLARPWTERLMTAGDAVWFYLGKLIWPHPLTTIYPRWEFDAAQWFSYLPLLILIVLLFILWLKRETGARAWFFTFAYFLAALLPVIGLVNLAWFLNSFVADHFQYLASMGPLALAGAGLVKIAKFILPTKPGLQANVCAALLLILGAMSWHRSWAYESQETLCTDTLAKNPDSWVAHNSLGVALSEKGRVDEAMAQFQRALEINPNFADAYNNLGNALLQTGQVDDAMAEYQKALVIDPNNINAHNNLGWALLQKGQVDEAIAECQKALEINPDFADAHGNLGIAFSLKGRADDAMAEFQKALAINPNDPKIHYNLGNVLLQKGQMDQATTEFQKALELDPNNARAHDKLGLIHFEKGQLDAAIADFQEALRLNPGDGAAQSNLAKAQALASRASESQ
ncbi:MAG: tetratricopeptide repeat protein [Methylacidiphilales bacterium]|nr:tetratricopeptide repeat protein [Candidatus Methylacidiphilales bacterium]